tara:strand:- start:65 stop:232 length:168 start_codon:yes stop_codon:yes gene_type:complete
MPHARYVKERLIAELRLIIDKYEDSHYYGSLSQLSFIDSIKNILNKPMYKEDEDE